MSSLTGCALQVQRRGTNQSTEFLQFSAARWRKTALSEIIAAIPATLCYTAAAAAELVAK